MNQLQVSRLSYFSPRQTSGTNRERCTKEKAKIQKLHECAERCEILPKCRRQNLESSSTSGTNSEPIVPRRRHAGSEQVADAASHFAEKRQARHWLLFGASCGFSPCVRADDKLSAAPSVLYGTGRMSIFTKQACLRTRPHTSFAFTMCSRTRKQSRRTFRPQTL